MKKWSPLNQIVGVSGPSTNNTLFTNKEPTFKAPVFNPASDEEIAQNKEDWKTLGTNYIDIDGDGKAEPWEYGLEAATWVPSIIAGVAGTATTGVGGVPAAVATKTGLKQGAKQIVKNVPKWWNKGKQWFNKNLRPWRTADRNVIDTRYVPRYPEINLGGFNISSGKPFFPHHGGLGMGRNTIPFRGKTFYNPNAKYGMSTLGMMGLKTLFSPTEDKRGGVDPLIIDQQNEVRENTPNPFIIQNDQSRILDNQQAIPTTETYNFNGIEMPKEDYLNLVKLMENRTKNQ